MKADGTEGRVIERNNMAEHQLLDAYNEAVGKYLPVVAKLATARWSLPQSEYLRVHREPELARVRSEQARLALEVFRQVGGA